MAAMSSSFAKLPTELQTLILRHIFANDPTGYLTYCGTGEFERWPTKSRREQLKELRLVCRIFHDAVTPAVFASIHIHASSLSLTRAGAIANSHLAGYVKELVHHQGSFKDQNKNQASFFITLASHKRRVDYPKHMKNADRHILLDNYLQEIQYASSFPDGTAYDLSAYLVQNILPRLPNLATFVSLPYHDDWHDPETSAYTLKRTGLSYLPKSSEVGNELELFIKCLKQSKFAPRTLNLSIFPFDALNHIMQDYEVFEFPFLSRLKTLKIGPDIGAKYGYGAINSEQYQRNTINMLRACTSLVHLELTNDFALSPGCMKIPKMSLPNLKTLTISRGLNLAEWPEKSLMDCIKAVGGTLTHLKFDGIALIESTPQLEFRDTPMDKVYTGSLVRLLYGITPSTKLVSITGLETVLDAKSRTSARGPYRGPTPGKEVLLRKLEDAACHRIAWPAVIPPRATNWSICGADPFVDKETFVRIRHFFWSSWIDTVDEFDIYESAREFASLLTRIINENCNSDQ